MYFSQFFQMRDLSCYDSNKKKKKKKGPEGRGKKKKYKRFLHIEEIPTREVSRK